MKNFIGKLFTVGIMILLPLLTQAQPVQRFAHLDNFRLANGKTMEDCVVGYRTCGRLNSTRTNAILFPTWFGGTSHDIMALTGAGMMADSTKYFVVAIDAFGNGVSSSPSNSKLQPNSSFPRFNIRDMVNAEYMLATRVLNLSHVFCVMGASMGGMQAFQWIVSYPNFMDKAVISVGSPKLSSNDLLLWNAELLAIKEGLRCNASEKSIENTVVAIHVMNLQTPDYYVEHVSHEEFPKFLKNTENQYARIFNPYNWMSQVRAMIAQNISKPFDGNMNKVAGVVRAKVLIIVSKQDHMVNPHPALCFAGLIKAKVLELNSDCGHLGTDCEKEKVAETVNRFLSE